MDAVLRCSVAQTVTAMRPQTRALDSPISEPSSSTSENRSNYSISPTMTPPVAAVELPRAQQPRLPSQGPYKYGMVMLCLGALINWLGLAENYIEPVRYIGVACIITGAILICVAMCCWVNSEALQTPQESQPVHVIDIENSAVQVKPPDYETVSGAPPSYDVAIKLNPGQLLEQNTTTRCDPPPEYTFAPVHLPNNLQTNKSADATVQIV